MRMSQIRTNTQPIPVRRSVRNHDLRVLTSLPAGKMVPVAAIPLLREDAVTRSRVRLSFESMETVELLMNAINVDVKAYLVPNLAFERFQGLDDFNRSYEGLPVKEGDPVVEYFETVEASSLGASNDILRYMGKHYKSTTQINTAYIEAYNTIWNFRAANRSPDISPRDRLDTDLAPAFWKHTQFAHIVPDFDQAVIDGEVPLNVTAGALPVRGLGFTISGSATERTMQSTSGSSGTAKMQTGDGWTINPAADGSVPGQARFSVLRGTAGGPAVFAEMQENGITVSLSNIELARKTQAFARLRQQYTGHSDDYIIDLLMDGISVPEQAWRQPILLAERSTIFGMSKRYATDAGNMTESVVNGQTFIDIGFSCPKVPTGGVIMIVAEITPEQLFERQKDHYLHTATVDELPQFLRDELDPEKVEVVRNDYIDIDHDQPSATFGYAPLNHAWTSHHPCIGGRFYRPEVDAGFDEDRQRIWAVETQNPVLSEDFYLCTTMHTKPFVVTNQDPFEVVARGNAAITGNTVFGGMLVEANGDYTAVMEEAPMERIEK